MAFDNIVLTTSGMSFPVNKDALATLTAQGVARDGGSALDITRMEFELLYAPLTASKGQKALKEVIARATDSSASPTGTYSVTFAASLFNKPGLYQVQAKGFVVSGGATTAFVTAQSADLEVVETDPQTLDDIRVKVVDHEARIDDLETP